MVKSFRFLLQFAWVNLGSIFGFAAIVIVGCCVTGVTGNAHTSNLFETYYCMFPTMILMMLFLYAFSLCTNNLNLGLSMGARRADFFWAIQGMILFYTAVCWVLQRFMSALPALANWEVRERWQLLNLFGGRPWTFPLLCAALMILGCLSGMVVVKNKVLGFLLVTLSIFVMIAATALLLLSVEARFAEFLLETKWAWLWTTLPQVTAALLAAGAAGGELLIWWVIQHSVVR